MPAVRASGRRETVALDAAVARVAQAVERARAAGQQVMVLDRRPGRVVSATWRGLLAALPRGFYATLPGEGETLAVLQEGLAKPQPLGLDLEGTCTLVSFGAPVLEGWGRPGRMLAVRKGLRVVQVDAWRSPSAALADEWVAIAPGGEGPLALALAHVVAREAGAGVAEDVRRSLAGFRPGTWRRARASSRRGSRRSAAPSSASRRPSRSGAATRARVRCRRTPSARSRS